MTDLEAAWNELHDAKPDGWFVGQPINHEHRREATEVTLGSWIRLGPAATTADGRLRLPEPPAGPGLYRFLFTAPTRSVYIGETEEFRRRFGGYTNPAPVSARTCG